MNKTKKVKKLNNKQRRIISLLVLILLISIIVSIVLLITTKGKKAISTQQFKDTFDENEYNLVDVIDQFSSYQYVKEACIAVSKDASYQIEFYVLENDNYAIDFFNRNKSIFESKKGSLSTETSADIKNCSRYTLNSNDRFMFLSRIDNTVVYIDVYNNYINNVNSIIEKLNY